jgi:hypothetical protein
VATDRERDAAFWRHLASLHEQQAQNLRKRAEQEDQDTKRCLERAKQAQAAGPLLSSPKPLPGAPANPNPSPPRLPPPTSSTQRLSPSQGEVTVTMAPAKPSKRSLPQPKPKKPISEL